uniref:transposase n=1 Tax=Ructibacterium gallinarum TaxID=2779355 RepID=UPI00385100DF
MWSFWSEGTFSVLKCEHKLKQVEKRGIHRVYEECLFSALALNLKRLVKKALTGAPNSYFAITYACVYAIKLWKQTI